MKKIFFGLMAMAITAVACKKEVMTDNSSNNNSNNQNSYNTPSYKYNTTTFNDGWSSTIKENWVEVSKDNIKVLIHYMRPYKNGVFFPADTQMAWDTLSAARYSNLTGYKTTYTNGYTSATLAMSTATEISSQKKVYVVLFRRSSYWLEVVAPDRNSFVQYFQFDPETTRWDSDNSKMDVLANMSGRNMFAVADADIDNTGKWSDHFSGSSFLYNYSDGSYQGISTYTSSEAFEFTKNRAYNWKIVAVNSTNGSNNIGQAKSSGTFKSVNDWQLSFSDIEGKAKTFDVYYSAVKGGRVLFMNDAAYSAPGSGKGFARE